MEDYRPFDPPSAILGDAAAPPDAWELAGRGARLGANLLDSLLLLVLVALCLGFAWYVLGLRFPVLPRSGLRLVYAGQSLLAALLYLAVNGPLLVRNGQTVGKRLCRIRIAKPDGSVPSLLDSFVKRHLVFALARLVPYVGFLLAMADVLLIFRDSRKCLHDDLAGTVVVKAPLSVTMGASPSRTGAPMRFLEEQEIHEWLHRHGIRIDPPFSVEDRAQVNHRARAATLRAAAERCVASLGTWRECLLLVTEWGRLARRGRLAGLLCGPGRPGREAQPGRGAGPPVPGPRGGPAGRIPGPGVRPRLGTRWCCPAARDRPAGPFLCVSPRWLAGVPGPPNEPACR